MFNGEGLALVFLLANGVMFVVSGVIVLKKANALPDPPNYPPASWDKLQLWVESKSFWPTVWAFLILGSIVTALLV